MPGHDPFVVFLDRDGVINRMRSDYVKRWEELEIVPGALPALGRLSAGGCELIVLTNQSAIGRGLVSRQTVDEIHRRLAQAIEASGGRVREFLVCPHTPSDGCGCRKPAPGLLIRARDEFGVDLSNAVLVGDQLSDVAAARAAAGSSSWPTRESPSRSAPLARSASPPRGRAEARCWCSTATAIAASSWNGCW